MNNSKFVALLGKYKMTFYWAAIDMKWWIIGQVENGCNQNSIPMPAENFNAAQVAALNYIQQKYKLDQYKIDPAKELITPLQFYRTE